MMTRNGRMSSGPRSGSNGKLSADDLKRYYAKGRRDFSLLTLLAIDLQKSSLTGTNFAESKLKKANLQNSDLSGVNFGRADLTEASLRGRIWGELISPMPICRVLIYGVPTYTTPPSLTPISRGQIFVEQTSQARK